MAISSLRARNWRTVAILSSLIALLSVAHIASGSHAQTFISEFYRNDPPFKRAGPDIVAVEVNSVLPTSDRTFEVEWVETTRDLYGRVKATDRFKGSFTVAISPPTDERQIRTNPLGIYVTQASWAKVL